MVNITDKRSKFQSANILSLSIIHFFHDVFSSFLAPLLPLLIEKLGISYSQAGFLSVVQRLPSIFNPFLGLIIDKLNLRLLIVIAPTLTAVSMSLLGCAQTYSILVFLLLLMGISTTLFHVPAPVMIREMAGERVGLAMSFFMVGGEAARAVGPLVIIGAVSLFGLGHTYYLIPIGVCSSVYLFFRSKSLNVSKKNKSNEEFENLSETLKTATPIMLSLVMYTFFCSGIKGALTLFLPIYLIEQGIDLWISGAALSVVQLSGVIGNMYAGNLSDKIGRANTLIITAIACPLLMCFFLYADKVFIFPLLLIIGMFLLAPMPVMLAIANEIDTEYPAFINGTYIMITFLVNSLGTLLIGLLADVYSLEFAYKISVLCSLGAIPVAYKLKSETQQICKEPT